MIINSYYLPGTKRQSTEQNHPIKCTALIPYKSNQLLEKTVIARDDNNTLPKPLTKKQVTLFVPTSKNSELSIEIEISLELFQKISEWFNALFAHPCQEQSRIQSSKQIEIDIPDSSLKNTLYLFNRLQNMLESKGAPETLSFEELCDLYTLTDYFLLSDLKERAEQLIKRKTKLSQEELISLLELGQKHDTLKGVASYALLNMIGSYPEEEFPSIMQTLTEKNGLLSVYGDVITSLTKPIVSHFGSESKVQVFLEYCADYCPNLTDIDLSHRNWTLQNIKFPKSTEKLDLSNNNSITDASLQKAIKPCLKLEEINLSSTRCSLENTIFSQALKKLILKDSQSVTNASLEKAIAPCLKLEELNLSDTRCSLENIVFPQALKKLILSHNHSVTDASLQKAITPCLKLEELDLSDTCCSLENIVFSQALKKLILNGNRSVTDASLQKAIQQCPKLEEISLSYSNRSLENISFPKPLKRLWLPDNQLLTNDSLQMAIKECSELEELDLSYTRCSLENIVFPKSLKRLILTGNQFVTNDFLKEAIKECSELEEISLSNTHCRFDYFHKR